MALIHRADLTPTKLELLNGWLPGRPWYQGPGTPDFQRVAAYRFDDPAGEVGIETLLVQAEGGPLLQVPLTYRGAPLDGAGHWLVGTTEHSVLGRRWVYDACGDPVYAAVLASVISTGSGEAEEYVDLEGGPQRRETTTHVRGTGDRGATPVTAVVRVDEDDPTRIVADSRELTVVRVLSTGDAAPAPLGAALTGTWIGQPDPVLLARALPAGSTA